MEYADVLPKKGEPFALPQLVLAGMRATELQTADQEVHGVEKKLIFKSVVQKVLEAARQLGVADGDAYLKLNTYLVVGVDLVDNLVETFISLSKNPTFIQLKQDMQQAVSGCCKKSKK
jgi:hypothetical protein